MDLPANALISVARCAERLSMTAEDDPQEELSPLIGYASDAIEKHCWQPLVRRTSVIHMDCFADGRLIIPFKPVLDFIEIRYDTSRVFGIETEVADYLWMPERSTILLGSKESYGEAVYRLSIDSGYSRVDYRQTEDPDDPLPGETWLNGAVFQTYNGIIWEVNDGIPMDDELEAACAEYVHFLRIRMRAGGAGLIKKERGYSFEGSAVEYETVMPKHVRDRLSPFVAHTA